MKNADATIHTIDGIAEILPVAQFRAHVEALERKVHVDRHACVGPAERAAWAAEATRARWRVLAVGSARASRADWDRRERALTDAAAAIAASPHAVPVSAIAVGDVIEHRGYTVRVLAAPIREPDRFGRVLVRFEAEVVDGPRAGARGLVSFGEDGQAIRLPPA